jgi:hypothetical protein
MKATLEFTLPEEQQEHLQAVMAGRAWGALSEVSHLLRSHYKYEADAAKTLRAIQDVVNDAKEDVE